MPADHLIEDASLPRSRIGRIVAFVLIGSFLGSIAGILTLTRLDLVKPEAVWSSVTTAILNLGVVAIVGAAVSLLTARYHRAKMLEDKSRDDRKRRIEYRDDLLQSLLSKTLDAYSRAKKARRFLRALVQLDAAGKEEYVVAEVYDEYMDLLNDAQLDLENVKREVDTNSQAFTNHGEIVEHIKRMEKRLNKVIGEYEMKRRLFSAEVRLRALDDHPCLADLVGSVDNSDFEKDFIEPCRKVQEAIRADLLHPNFRGSDY